VVYILLCFSGYKKEDTMKNIVFKAALLSIAIISSVASADIVDPNAEKLIFSYDVDPGILNGELISVDHEIGTLEAFDYSESTFSFWVNITGTESSWASIFHIGNFNGERYPGVWLYEGSSLMHYRMATKDDYNASVGPEPFLPFNEWVMVTSTLSGGITTLYLNDEIINQVEREIDWTPFEGEVWSIYAGDPWHLAAPGYIDDIRVYDMALTQEGVSDLVVSNIVANDVGAPFLSSILLLGLGLFGRQKKQQQ
jgi:hypothetical protein